jgi:hypothetical protein
MTAMITGGQVAVAGQPGDVDTTARNILGTRAMGRDTTGNSAEYIYLQGIGSTIVGSVVTFDEAGLTALIAANAKGPVAVATAITVASTYGWYGIQGTFLTDVVASCADNATIGRETTDGKVGDNRAAGDQIANAFSRASTTGAAVILCQFDHSYVDDFMGV